MYEQKTFTDQPVRLLVRNAEGTEFNDVRFRADIEARLDPGIRSAAIPALWKGNVKHEGRSFVVSLREDSDGQEVWFHADVLDDAGDDDDEDEDEDE